MSIHNIVQAIQRRSVAHLCVDNQKYPTLVWIPTGSALQNSRTAFCQELADFTNMLDPHVLTVNIMLNSLPEELFCVEALQVEARRNRHNPEVAKPDEMLFSTQPVTWNKDCLKATPCQGAEADYILDLFNENACHQTVFVKNTADAFAAENAFHLNKFLSGRGIDTIILSGLNSDACVPSTGVGSRKAGFNTYVLADRVMSFACQAGLASEKARNGFHRIDTRQEIGLIDSGELLYALQPVLKFA